MGQLLDELFHELFDARRRRADARGLPPRLLRAVTNRGIVAAMASFWLVNTLYQVLIPLPLPSRLFPLRLALIGFAVLTAGAHGIAFRALDARPQATPV